MSKYNRQCKGVTIDVYDVLLAFEVTNPALQHLVKKALCAGLRGHKDKRQDLEEILESAKRAVEIEEELLNQKGLELLRQSSGAKTKLLNLANSDFKFKWEAGE